MYFNQWPSVIVWCAAPYIMLPLDENSRTDDILLGITHVVRHAADFGIDPSNIILSGDSFGSQMALSMAFTNGNLFKKISINNPPAQNVLLNLLSHPRLLVVLLLKLNFESRWWIGISRDLAMIPKIQNKEWFTLFFMIFPVYLSDILPNIMSHNLCEFDNR